MPARWCSCYTRIRPISESAQISLLFSNFPERNRRCRVLHE
jgi:hypothetical protein